MELGFEFGLGCNDTKRLSAKRAELFVVDPGPFLAVASRPREEVRTDSSPLWSVEDGGHRSSHRGRPWGKRAVVQGARSSEPFVSHSPTVADRAYCLISTITGLSMSFTRMTTVLEGLSVRLLPKCGVFGGV